MTPAEIKLMHNRDEWYRRPEFLGPVIAGVLVFLVYILPRILS